MLKIYRRIAAPFRALKRSLWVQKVRMSCNSAGVHLFVGGASSVNSRTVIGDHCSTNGLVIKGSGSVTIGDYFHSGSDVLILTSNHAYKTARYLPYDEIDEDKNVEIGRAVWVGDRVTILGGVSIGEGAILQASSVVVSDIPPLAVAGGNPARVFKYRDKEHYNSLVAQGAFLRLD